MSSAANKDQNAPKPRALTAARRAQNRESQARYRLKQKKLAEKAAQTNPLADDTTSDTSIPLCESPRPLIAPQGVNLPNVTSSEDMSSVTTLDSIQTEPLVRQISTAPIQMAESFGQSTMSRLGQSSSINYAWEDNCDSTQDSTPFPPNDCIPLFPELQQPSVSSSWTLSSFQDPITTTGDQNRTGQQCNLPPVPFLFTNHIRLHDMTFLAATLAIAQSINVTPDDYLNDRPSPFYLLSHATSMDSASSYFRQAVKPHLRPSITQLSRPHASYLDLIIFPQFREHAVLLATTNPCMLDQQQLVSDMLAGGLTCWGNAQPDNAGRGGGVPWDMRSWEAKPWLVRKWWFLIGVNDEMLEISSWWRAMRGEDGDWGLDFVP